ncbi:MAG: DUF488 family protein [Candidatus Thorarchaeota archaeon]
MSEKQEIKMIAIGKLKPDPNQPRWDWTNEETKRHIDDLASSYKVHGMIQPIEVDDDDIIILGECRWRAAKKAKLKRVPVRRVFGISQDERFERQLIDDAQRKTLSDFERTWAYAAAVASINDPDKTYKIPQIKRMWERNPRKLLTLIALDNESGRIDRSGPAELSRRTGISLAVISNHLVYFDENLPRDAREAIAQGLLSPTEMTRIKAIKTPIARETITTAIAEERKEARVDGKSRIHVSVEDRVGAIRDIEDDAKEGFIPEPSEKLIEAVAKAEISPEATRYVAEVEPDLQPKVIEEIKSYEPSRAADAAREIVSRLPRKSRVDVQESLERFSSDVDIIDNDSSIHEYGEKAAFQPRLDVPLFEQYQHQRLWNIRRLVGYDISERPSSFRFDIITTGFSQKSLDGLLEALEEADVKLVLDIRKNPVSQYRPEFNKSNFSERLSGIDIEYEHIPALGIPRNLRNEALAGRITVDELWRIYDREILTTEMIEYLNRKTIEKGTVALFCTEVSPELCHRHRIVLALEKVGRLCFDI